MGLFKKKVRGLTNNYDEIDDYEDLEEKINEKEVNIDDIINKNRYKPILDTKKKTILITTGFILFILFAGIGSTLDVIKAKTPVVLEFPKGVLSSSIFDSQNTVYQATQELPNQADFTKIPYIVDVPDTSSARIDTGSAFEINDKVMMFLSEFKTDADLTNILIAQLGKAYLIDIDESKCVLQPFVRNEGYINGYAAEYRADVLRISNNETDIDVYIEGYTLQITKDYEVYIGVSSNEVSQELLNAMEETSRLVVNTIRYSEELAESQQKEQQQALLDSLDKNLVDNNLTKQETTKYSNIANENSAVNYNQTDKNSSYEQNKNNNETKTDSSAGVENILNGSNSNSSKNKKNNEEQADTNTQVDSNNEKENDKNTQTSPQSDNKTDSVNENVRSLMLPITSDYKDITVEFVYSNTKANISIYITDANETIKIMPDSISNGIATFKMGSVIAGNYIIKVNGDDCGDCSANIIDNSGV